jgi:hypothetical protein
MTFQEVHDDKKKIRMVITYSLPQFHHDHPLLSLNNRYQIEKKLKSTLYYQAAQLSSAVLADLKRSAPVNASDPSTFSTRFTSLRGISTEMTLSNVRAVTGAITNLMVGEIRMTGATLSTRQPLVPLKMHTTRLVWRRRIARRIRPRGGVVGGEREARQGESFFACSYVQFSLCQTR